MEPEIKDLEQEIRKYIQPIVGSDVKLVCGIKEGCSDALKYKVKIGNRYMMLKKVRGTAEREMWYRELAKYSGKGLLPPQIFKYILHEGIYLLTSWEDGITLDEYLKNSQPNQIENFGKQAAEIMLNLHRYKYFFPVYKRNLELKVQKICSEIEKYGLDFPENKRCSSFLLENASKFSVDSIHMVHKDIRPENFIVNGNKIVLIDFDNGGVGERAEDFSYFTTIIKPEHREFSESVIRNYLHNMDTAEFWEKNLFFSTLKVAEYAVWKYQRSGRKMKYQAENLMNQYDYLNNIYPKWLVNYN